ncbi:MAG: hypothetical protein JJW01_01690 [Alphaproteobacteria bacterium]|nr:hypothetical protein [Rickettsiales bacterium]
MVEKILNIILVVALITVSTIYFITSKRLSRCENAINKISTLSLIEAQKKLEKISFVNEQIADKQKEKRKEYLYKKEKVTQEQILVKKVILLNSN